MDWKQKQEYVRKANKRRSELQAKLFLTSGLSQIEKDIIVLEMIELDIMPDSRWWRWGYKGVIKRARNALKEKLENEHQRERPNKG